MKTIAVALAIVCLGALPASAQPVPPGAPKAPGAWGRGQGPPLAGPILAKIAQEVGLSDAQIAKIKQLGFAAQRQAIPVHSQLATARLDLQEAMDADKAPSEQRVSDLIEKVGKMETQLKKNHVLMLLRVRNTMSLQQWRKLETLHAERQLKMRMGKRFGKMGNE